MRIVRLVGGEVVRERYIRSRLQRMEPIEGPVISRKAHIDLTASRYIRRIRFMFLMYDVTASMQRYHFEITAGEWVLRIYPEGYITYL